MTAFDYAEMVSRNAGFVNGAEQDALRRGGVFVCGIGGMGGAAAMMLARAGVGRIAITDFDRFEPSNINRQLFAFSDTLGEEKTAVTRDRLLAINPRLEIETYDRTWPSQLDAILPRYGLVINGMDDIAAGIALYRKAREHDATVIDAYTAPLPSVTAVRPSDPRPEERLGYPTVGRDVDCLTDDARHECLRREVEYVLIHSSSADHIDLQAAADVVAGRRSRMSFAPVVVMAGCLMSFEAVSHLMGRPTRTDYRGWFFNPWTGRTEHPRRGVSKWIRRRFVRHFMARVTDA